MPTGYTDAIKIDTPFSDFALRCARNFGALIEMRDDPLDAKIPDEFVADSYHLQNLERLISEQEAANKMTLEAAAVAIERHNAEQAKSRERVKKESAEIRARYERMLGLVRAWTPPTPEHVRLKDFMDEQITSSIEWDCHDSDDFLDQCYPIFTGTPAQWIARRQEQVAKDIEYHKKHHADDCERARGRTTWVKALRQSLQDR